MESKTENYLVDTIKDLQEQNNRATKYLHLSTSISNALAKELDKYKAKCDDLEKKLTESDMQLNDYKLTCMRLVSFVINTLQLDILETTEDGIINKSVVDKGEIPDSIIKAFRSKKIQDDIRREKKDGGKESAE